MLWLNSSSNDLRWSYGCFLSRLISHTMRFAALYRTTMHCVVCGRNDVSSTKLINISMTKMIHALWTAAVMQTCVQCVAIENRKTIENHHAIGSKKSIFFFHFSFIIFLFHLHAHCNHLVLLRWYFLTAREHSPIKEVHDWLCAAYSPIYEWYDGNMRVSV